MRYRVLHSFEIFCGQIGLTEQQAAARARNLRPLAAGLYEIINPVQFKVGEVIELTDPEKAILGKIECLDQPEAPPQVQSAQDEPRQKRKRKSK